jgi:hypothetical protein
MQKNCVHSDAGAAAAHGKNNSYNSVIYVERRGRGAASGVRNQTVPNEFLTQMTEITYRSREIAVSSDVARLRIRATRMLELATRAHCEQNYNFSRLFTQLADEVFTQARELEGPFAACATARVGELRRAVRNRS